eukprot:Skav219497  [mRNA]  locus=scaffold937:75476:75658:- [translate_table: standard]
MANRIRMAMASANKLNLARLNKKASGIIRARFLKSQLCSLRHQEHMQRMLKTSSVLEVFV